MKDIIALVLAGGQGTRFWPESTKERPKQYLSIVTEKPLIYETFDRLQIPLENRYVVTVKSQVGLVHENTKNVLEPNKIIIEPSGRNTAPCIFLSLMELIARGHNEEDCIAVLSSDHVILDAQKFNSDLEKARDVALKNKGIVTIGIPPRSPHTGYGYIELGEENKVLAFKEKPNLETAKKYLDSGKYLWNAGMFVGSIKVFLDEFQRYCPSIFNFKDEFLKELKNKQSIDHLYEKLDKDSIDYAIIEKSENIYCVPASFDWNDIGAWSALEEVLEKQNGNVFAGSTKPGFIENSKGNIVYSPNQHVCLIDCEDLIVVSNENGLVIMPKEKSQKVKDIVEDLKERKLDHLL